MVGKKNPGALAGASGAGMTFKAATLNVFQISITPVDGTHHALGLEHLRFRHKLHGPLAGTIASLAYDGERR